MTKALSAEEKRIRQTKRDEKKIEKLLNPKLDERCYEILRILRDAPKHPEIKYNSKYFENHFQTSNITILRAIRTLKDMDLADRLKCVLGLVILWVRVPSNDSIKKNL